MQKKDARNIFKVKRQSLTERDRLKLDDLLLIQLQLAGLPFVSSLLSYWPIEEQKEPDTHLFTKYLQFKNPGLIVCYPKADFSSGSMQAVITNEETSFEKSGMKIFEPKAETFIDNREIDMVFVPLIAFDKHGYRVGYGKGFYDKWLQGCRPDCIKIGFSYFDPVDTLDGRHEFDVPLDLCITPQQIYVF